MVCLSVTFAKNIEVCFGIGILECCICEKRKTAKSGSGYETLEKCETENGARTLQKAAASDKYSLLQAKVLGSDWQTILAMEYQNSTVW